MSAFKATEKCLWIRKDGSCKFGRNATCPHINKRTERCKVKGDLSGKTRAKTMNERISATPNPTYNWLDH